MSERDAVWIDVAEMARLDRARRAYRRRLEAGRATVGDLHALVVRFGRAFGWDRPAPQRRASRRRPAGRRSPR